jgi:nickel superoxide dismutase
MRSILVKHIMGFLLIAFLFNSSQLFAHCQMPCGIYGDQMRINMLKENVITIEKAMNQIIALSKEATINYNQLVRWVNTKEEHAQKIQDMVSAYFLTQRIKPVEASDKEGYSAYLTKTATLQQMLVTAMKTKQTTDVQYCVNLNTLIDSFSQMYFSAEDLQHLKEHKE